MRKKPYYAENMGGGVYVVKERSTRGTLLQCEDVVQARRVADLLGDAHERGRRAEGRRISGILDEVLR